MKRITVIGIGRIGGALAIAIARAGFHIEELVYRSKTSVDGISSQFEASPAASEFNKELSLRPTDIVLIAVPDPEIAGIAKTLAATHLSNTVVLHVSGSLSSEVLAPLAETGCRTASMHPLISVSDPVAGSESFVGSYFCVEGDTEAAEAATELISALSAIPFSIPTENKVLYHAAAVIACGHLTALIDIASELMRSAGVPADDSTTILLPLIESTIENIKSKGTVAALTGSFARADAETVGEHIQKLKRSFGGDTLDLYRILGERSLALAAERGVDPERIRAVREVLLSD